MNRNDAVIPFYVQVAETLRRRIVTCEIPEGSLLPTTEELEREFGVSRITVQKALALLAEEGLVHRKRGLGTFVAKQQRDLVTIQLSGSADRIVRSIENLPTELDVLDISTMPCPNHVAQMIGLEQGNPVWRMKKVRNHSGSPLCYYVHYCSPAFGERISKSGAEQKNFVDLFTEISGRKLHRLEQTLEATIADGELAKILHVRFGAPLLYVENLYYAEEHEPAVLTQIHYRSDRCSIKASVQL